MKLSRDSFNVLYDTISDRVPNRGILDLMSTQCHRPPADFVGDNEVLPIAIKALIEDCASQDTLKGFIECVKRRYGGNALIDALDFAALVEGPSDAEIVATGGGSTQFKAQLTTTLAQLEVPGMHLVAAQDLEDLLTGASDAEAKTLYLAVLGNVKVDRPPQVVRGLVSVMSKTLTRLIGDSRPEGLELDLDRTRLPRIDLRGLDLHEADIAFADLGYANLDDANLTRARGYAVDISGASFNAANLEEARLHFAVGVEARFHNARLVSAFFKDANLSKAEFQRARLQGAHLERADLSGAKFAQANLKDAYFTGATFDEAAIASISRAVGWERARFDAQTREAISQQV